MEVTTCCRKRSARAEPGVTLWTLEILEKRIVHQLLVSGSRRDCPAVKRHGRARSHIRGLSPMLLSNFLGESRRGRSTEVSHIPNCKSMQLSESRNTRAPATLRRTFSGNPLVAVPLR